MSTATPWQRLLHRVILLFARMRLPTRPLHLLRYGRVARHLRLARGSCILANELAVSGPVSIGKGTRILADTVRLGANIRLGAGILVYTRSVSFSDNVIIDDAAQLTGAPFDTSSVELGRGVWIFEHCVLNTTMGLSIGDGTGVGGHSMIWTHGSWQSYLDGFPVRFAPTRLGRNVWLPWHVIILPGVTIGDDVTVGAGSVIVKDVPPRSLVAGSPAKVLKSSPEWPVALGEKEVAARVDEIMEHFARWVTGYFDARELLGSRSAGARWTLERRQGNNLSFVCSDGERAEISVVGEERPAPAPLEGADRTLFVYVRGTAPSPEPTNFVSVPDHVFETRSRSELFSRFLVFVTQYGIRLRDRRSGLLNHQLD